MRTARFVWGLGVLGVACGEPAPAVVTPTPMPSARPTASAAPSAPASAAPSAPASAAATTSKPTAPAGPLLGGSFGDKRYGFAEASSKNGRFVFLRRFQGAQKPTFGQHGESRTPTDLTLFDRVDGTERPIDDLLDVGDRRYFLVVEGGALRVLDADTGASIKLDGADMATDANACLPPRQGNFSSNGRRVAWVTSAGLSVRDLDSGVTWVVKPNARLWRGWPDDTGKGATLAEVPAGGSDWPHQNTSCACRWCGRFAMSYGMYGWSGPSFTIEHVDDAGARAKGDPPKSGPRHGPTQNPKCTLTPTAGDALEEGPWQWKCG